MKCVCIHTPLNNDFTAFLPAEFFLFFVRFSEGQESGYPSSFWGHFSISEQWLSIQFLGPFYCFRAAVIHPVFGAISLCQSSSYPSGFWGHFILSEQRLSIQFLGPFPCFIAAVIHPVSGAISSFHSSMFSCDQYSI